MTNVNDEFKENEEVVMETPDNTDDIIESGEDTEEIEIVENGEETIVQELTEKLQEEENKRLRLLADYENFKRRATLDKEALQKYRAQNVVTNLIPVLDNFARALTVEATTEEAQTMMTGLDMIYRTFLQALEDEGLVEIQALDQEFDPNFHQAIMTGSDEDKPAGIVLEQMQAGYMLKDRVLRPAMVKVNE
ncbi:MULTISPECIES: nucleotide exchange factor GrpE [Sporosarcina]|uniref:Protein GrpE n=1 Tax=Sporosarcina psychrophila TaxID=1476 RepID=A0ABV2K652_SPOPS|nr:MULTISPECIES: nucleotide exchange factor GrpE [Sporosarcina]AMQ06077.1 nucleotide exchange factor GrpE [Sporosarcina psychrophila]QNK90043.1 nucleotide exchange factor GrpE [Sporosarcina sp. resist]